MAKTVPISVRIPQHDADFLANLQIEGAATPSDKIREIIKEARKKSQYTAEYPDHLKAAHDALLDLSQSIKTLELEQKQHSELVAAFIDWITEAFAYSASLHHKLENNKTDLKDIENGISERIFRLFEAAARMSVTRNAPCYDRDIMTHGFHPILELIQLISERLSREK